MRMKVAMVALLAAALVAPAAAAPAELRIFPDQSSTEINSFTSYEVEVINRGSNADRYRLSSPDSEVTVAPDNVPRLSDQVLEPGDSETVNVWYNPGPEKDAGFHSFTVRATSRASGQTYSVEGTAEVIKNHEVSVNVLSPGAVCKGEQAEYQVQVTNEGIQAEEFKVTPRFGSVSQERVNLEPGETRTVTLTASSDSETQRSFNVVVASTTSYAQEVESVQFASETCYDSEIEIEPENPQLTAFEEANFNVTVRNTGTRTDTFRLSSGVGQFEDPSLRVGGNSFLRTRYSFVPQEPGEQTVSITANSTVANTEEFTFDVENGMESRVGFADDRRTVCEEGATVLAAEIENTGTAEETFNLSATHGQLSDQQATLSPGDSATVELTVVGGQLERGTQTVNLTSTATTFGEPVNRDSVDLTVENCYDLEMDVEPRIASAGENRSTVYEITLTNTGTRENLYNVSADGPEWISVQPDNVRLAAGETSQSFIYAGIPFGKESGEIRITAEAVGTSVERNQTVQLVIGEELEEAIQSADTNASSTFDRLPTAQVVTSNLGKVAASLIVGVLVTAAVLYREW